MVIIRTWGVQHFRLWSCTPPPPQYVFMAWSLIKQWIRIHGKVLS